MQPGWQRKGGWNCTIEITAEIRAFIQPLSRSLFFGGFKLMRNHLWACWKGMDQLHSVLPDTVYRRPRYFWRGRYLPHGFHATNRFRFRGKHSPRQTRSRHGGIWYFFKYTYHGMWIKAGPHICWSLYFWTGKWHSAKASDEALHPAHQWSPCVLLWGQARSPEGPR